MVLLPTAVLMWRGRTGHEPAATGASDSREPRPTGDEALGPWGRVTSTRPEGRTVAYRVRRLWAGLGVSFVAGDLSGLLGIGGGVFKVPALHLFCGVPMKAAAATSNFMIGVTAAASAFLYYGRGEVRLVADLHHRARRARRLGRGHRAQPPRRGAKPSAGSSPPCSWPSPSRCSTTPGAAPDPRPTRCAMSTDDNHGTHRLEHWVHWTLLSGLLRERSVPDRRPGRHPRPPRGGPPRSDPPRPGPCSADRSDGDVSTLLLELGLLVLMATPVLRVVALAVGWTLAGEYRFALVAFVVLACSG